MGNELDVSSGQKTVAIWINVLLPPSETFILNQASSLSRWRAVFVGREPSTRSLIPGSSDRTILQRPNRLSRTIFKLRRRSGVLDRYLKTDRVDLIHAHFGWSAVDIVKTAKAHFIPLVVTFHGADVTERRRRPRLKYLIYRIQLRQVFKYATRLIAVSEYIANELVSLGAPPDKIVVHYIGIRCSPDRPEAKRTGVLFVGRLVEKKGLSDLIRAISMLPSDLSSAPLVVVGAGPLRSELESEASQLGVNVEFRGLLDPESVQTEMSRATVFCVPSRTARNGDSEGLGMVFLEAANAGTPVVSTRHGGVPEAVLSEETGLLVPEADPFQLSRALQRIYRSPSLRQELGSKGRERVRQHFNIINQTALLEELYDSVKRSAST